MKELFRRTTRDAGWKWYARTLTPGVLLVSLLVLFWFALPSPLFRDPYATVVYDRSGRMLGARIAADGQWRFPEISRVPDKFTTCLLEYEDRYFYFHPGINPGSLFRATRQNISAGRVVSGGSTLTMQTIRLSRKGHARTVMEKLMEMFLAFRLELSFSKSSILKMYASHAPFGGNTVGLGAASWRYFGRPPEELSWSEAALLAVLPNAPSAMHPGRNRDLLAEKRNRLLLRLLNKGAIDATTYKLACEEPLPDRPQPLPDLAPHYTARMAKEQPGKQVNTSIDAGLQKNVMAVAEHHQRVQAANMIFNSAILVLDLKSGEVLAYVGNTAPPGDPAHSPEVDCIMAPRSSGSILKPFLYAAMMDAGELLPGMLVPDVPSDYSGFSPKNFSLTYDGAVPARKALSRSLNIPAVFLLREYGVQPFYDLLKKLGLTTLNKPASHYGLSLILGGAEARLWDVSHMYVAMGRSLLAQKMPSSSGPLSNAAAWLTLDALRDVNRPEEEEGWQSFASSREIAWKTGTSFGFRDAWSVGMTTDFLVGVWAGNADGEGRPGLTGVSVAAPLMFEVFRLLPASGHWFPVPFEELEKTPVCRQSGHRPSIWCPETDSVYIALRGMKSDMCPYHKLIHLDPSGKFRVNADCYPAAQIVPSAWFILPPALASYYRFQNPYYRELPPLMDGCNDKPGKMMQFVYPAGDYKLMVPRGPDGHPGVVVFEAAHQIPGTAIFWHIDEQYLGSTRDIHKMSFTPPPGVHYLVLVDENGERLTVKIEVLVASER